MWRLWATDLQTVNLGTACTTKKNHREEESKSTSSTQQRQHGILTHTPQTTVNTHLCWIKEEPTSTKDKCATAYDEEESVGGYGQGR